MHHVVNPPERTSLLTPADFTALLQPHYDDAARYSRLLCASWHAAQAEEVFQQALVQAYEKAGTLRDRDRFRPWLFRIILRCFQQEHRRMVRSRLVPLDASVRPADGGLFTPHEDYPWKQALLAALAHLTPKARSALLLHEVAGFPIREVSRIQGDLSVSATKMRLHRARSRMRALLSSGPAPPADAPPLTDLTHETLRLVDDLGKRRPRQE